MEVQRFSLDLRNTRALLKFLQKQKAACKLSNTVLTLQDFEQTTVKLPIVFPKFDSEGPCFEHALNRGNNPLNVGFVLMQAGSAALGMSEDEVLHHHKVIKKYMVRKKQGKAQIKHLKTKGKSRLGSRIRLQQSEKFFNGINAKLNEWKVGQQADVICYSAAKSLWPLLFTRDRPFVPQNDKRLKKIPVDLEEPNFKVLKYANKLVHKSLVETASETFVNHLLKTGITGQ